MRTTEVLEVLEVAPLVVPDDLEPPVAPADAAAPGPSPVVQA